MSGYSFRVLPGRFSVVKLQPDAPIPAFPEGARLFSVTRTETEVSIVCDDAYTPTEGEIERTWKAIQLVGPLEFSPMGVLVSFLVPLHEAKVSVFALSTFETDTILVKEFSLSDAVQALEAVGHVRVLD